jgi:D-sorbitol dehydrogenase (acceptor)
MWTGSARCSPNTSIGRSAKKKRPVGEAVPFGRMGLPADHAGASVFLASSDSDYVVAQTLNVDGGNWMS